MVLKLMAMHCSSKRKYHNYNSDNNWYGDINVTVSVTDVLLTDTISFTLTVDPVNDSPVLAFISNQEIDEDSSLSLEIDGFDIDGDVLSYDASIVSGNGELGMSDNLLLFNPESNWNGNVEILVEVSDEEYSVNQNFNVLVNPVNDAPLVGNIEINTNEDESINFDFVVSDVDNDISDLNILFLTNQDYGVLNVDGLSASYTPNQDFMEVK